MRTFLQEIKEYVGFSDADTDNLNRFLAKMGDESGALMEKVSAHFYECIMKHPDAHRAITGGDAQVQRLRRTMEAWMRSGLQGPLDEAFYERRARIGRKHVAISLPQQYMLTAMNVMRLDFRRLIEKVCVGDAEERSALGDSLDRWLDIELAIMLETYAENSSEQLQRKERLATIGQLAASIGHDLRNPLGVIGSSIYILKKKAAIDEHAQRHLDKIAGQIEACEGIVTNLLDLARNREASRVEVDLVALMDEVKDVITVAPDIELRFDVQVKQRVWLDRVLLRQAAVNIVQNAIQALDRTTGSVDVRIVERDGNLVLQVEDTGPGFKSEMLQRAFRPLVTGTSGGTGLGLAIVSQVAQKLGGTAYAENREEGGARVTIECPICYDNTVAVKAP